MHRVNHTIRSRPPAKWRGLIQTLTLLSMHGVFMRYFKPTVILILILASSAHADTFKSAQELRPFVDSVMKKAASGDIAAALNAMGPYTIIPEAEFQSAVLNSKAQRDQYGVRYGKSVGYEYISEEKAGESLIRLVYIEKTEKHALPWVFYFYKSPQGWVLNSFQWNDQLPIIFSIN